VKNKERKNMGLGFIQKKKNEREKREMEKRKKKNIEKANLYTQLLIPLQFNRGVKTTLFDPTVVSCGRTSQLYWEHTCMPVGTWNH
jgi:hypothetical protein